MLVVTVEFLHGVMRADPDGLGLSGGQTSGEWPPAPYRLFAALVAADGTRDACRWTDGSELEMLENAPPPVIHASPFDDVVHNRIETRFVVQADASAKKGSMHQEYPARTGAEVRPGVRVAPQSPVVSYVWDCELPRAARASLAIRAARVGYVGTSESAVRVTIADAVPANAPATTYVPDATGTTLINVPHPGTLRALDALYDRWLKSGPVVARNQSPALDRRVRYRDPASAVAVIEPEPTTFWLRLERPLVGRRAFALATAFKAALLKHYDSMAGEPPPVLHGHGFSGSGYEHARFLPLIDAGHRHARGRIHGLAVWLPIGTDPEVIGNCRQALNRIARLYGPGFDVGVSAWAGEASPVAATPPRWIGPARRWATVLPARHERHGPVDLAEVARWCRNAGLPEPISAVSARVGFVAGAVQLAASEANRPGRARMPYSHVALEFAEAVRGPVVIGGGRQFGMGLCLPLDRRQERG